MSRRPGLCLEEDRGLGQRKERKRKSQQQFPFLLAPSRFPLTSGPRALTCQWRRKREGWRQEGAQHRGGTHRVTLPLRTPEIPPARAAVQPRAKEQRDGCQPSKVMGSKHYFSMY